ncbi:MAG: hypothetical protein MZV63_00955 [Marinilabiliales bacterium]|nr:hypothetical protein [Marinilabiliales bacterium]
MNWKKGTLNRSWMKYSWNVSRSAKALKVDRVTLYNKIRKYDLKQKE